MCIIVVKNKGEKMPAIDTLKNCFTRNADGCGFMVADGENVHIFKGFMTFKDFENALNSAVLKYGSNSAYVMHFRISTQGGVQEELCHPYALTTSIERMRKLNDVCKIGVAHNGVISHTSDYTATTYNDTMRFIADELSYIINTPKYYKDKRSIKVINALIEHSRLAILDYSGHVELIGEGWTMDDGCWYSNTSYKPYTAPVFKGWTGGGWSDKDYWPYSTSDKVALIERKKYNDFVMYTLCDCDGDVIDYLDVEPDKADGLKTAGDVIAEYNKGIKHDADKVRAASGVYMYDL